MVILAGRCPLTSCYFEPCNVPLRQLRLDRVEWLYLFNQTYCLVCGWKCWNHIPKTLLGSLKCWVKLHKKMQTIMCLQSSRGSCSVVTFHWSRLIHGKKWRIKKHGMRRNKCHKTKQLTLPAIFIHLASHYYFPLPNLKFGRPFSYFEPWKSWVFLVYCCSSPYAKLLTICQWHLLF